MTGQTVDGEELLRLRAQVAALADANALAAELMGELEDARAVQSALRRRGEELELQSVLDTAIQGHHDVPGIAQAALATLVDAAALELEPGAVGFIFGENVADLRQMGRVGSPDTPAMAAAVRAAMREEPAPRAALAADGSLVVFLTAARRSLGALAFRARPSVEWQERWLALLGNFGSHIGTALERARTEAENHRIHEALEDARDRALEANRAKSRFLANMSHELRTPLNAIIGYSELLHEEAVDLGYGSLTADLEKVSGAGRHLLGLINDILDLSKIEAGRMELHLTSFEVPATLRDVADTIQPLLDQNGNRLDVEVCPEVGVMYADEGKLRQNLLNLLSNAAKFTKGGTITLRLEAAPRAGTSGVRFSVMDTGIGMTPEQQERVFEAFAQADGSTTRQYGGTGLGLAITERFCTMMGGTISVQSEVGQGTTFSFWLPVTVGDDTSDDVVESEGASRVLVIDDDPMAREVLSRMLTNEGYSVRGAASGAAGLAAAAAWRPDAITLDVMMPGRDGWSVLRSLRNDPELGQVPVVMVTLVPDQGLGVALGASEYLTKPVERGTLVRVLERHVGRLARDEGGHVLVVDDDPSARTLARKALERAGYVVDEASNGREALARVAERRPMLVLLDLNMPEMNGFDFLQELRRQDHDREIPVVVVTAEDLEADQRSALRASVSDILDKNDGCARGLPEIVDLVSRSLSRR